MRSFIQRLRSALAGAARRAGLQQENGAFINDRWRGLMVVCFILAASAVWLAARAPLAIYPHWFNIDEAEWAASAPNFLDGPIVWRSMDLTTSGPLNALPLLWPYLFGETPTLMTGRLAAFVLNAASLGLIAGALFHATRRMASIALVAPLYSWSISAAHGDFSHYSSETFSIFLFSLGALLLSVYARTRSLVTLFFIGLLFGALPFAKLQSSLIGMFCGLFALAMVAWLHRGEVRRLGRHAAFLIAGALVPLALLVGPLLFVGEIDAFTKGYLLLGVSYGDGPSFGGMKLLAGALPALLLFWIAPVAFVAAGLFAAATASNLARKRWPPAYFILCAGGAALLTAMVTTVAPGRPFEHYAQYTAWMSPFAAAGLYIFLIARQKGERRAARAVDLVVAATAGLCALLVFLFAPAAEDGPFADRREWMRAFSLAGLFSDRPALLDWTDGEPRRMLVWGWSPAIYVDAQARPAARTSHTQPVFEFSQSAYYRERMLKDIARTPVDVLVDAVADGEFHYAFAVQTPLEGAFPELLAASGLARFENRVQAPRTCPAIYLPPPAIADLSARLIDFAGAEATAETPDNPAERVADRSVFERCADYWLLPDGAAGAVALPFPDEEEIAEIWLLNTRNNAGFDRAAGDLEVKLTRRGETAWRSGSVHANPYPQWTVITLMAPVRADALTVSVTSHLGRGGGLNEVMAFRAKTK